MTTREIIEEARGLRAGRYGRLDVWTTEADIAALVAAAEEGDEGAIVACRELVETPDQEEAEVEK